MVNGMILDNGVNVPQQNVVHLELKHVLKLAIILHQDAVEKRVKDQLLKQPRVTRSRAPSMGVGVITNNGGRVPQQHVV